MNNKIYTKKITLKPGNCFHLDLKISTNKKVTFDKAELNMYLYLQLKKYFKKNSDTLE